MARTAVNSGRVAAVDLGTNSMRLLILQQTEDGVVEVGRWERVTGLGRGVDASGKLGEEGIKRTLPVLAEYGARMRQEAVERARVVATSASRDAANRESFFVRAEAALGYRPQLIGGREEASFSYTGATKGIDRQGPFLVIDIGGGSTEFVTETGGVSVDIGSVRLTERVLSARPAPMDQLAASREMVSQSFSGVSVGQELPNVIGVAGTFTSLAAIHLELTEYDRQQVHGTVMTSTDLEGLVDRLSGLTVEETAAIPALDPARAPVILAGALIARAALTHLKAGEITVSVHDLLDGVVQELLNQR
jgi:exopolyphosphatase/guanosine-5'-triphosphate,3'-diphosphate pyrophosphatase